MITSFRQGNLYSFISIYGFPLFGLNERMLSPLRAVVDITMTEKSSLISPCEDMKLFILSISFQSLQYPSNSLELTHPFIQIPTGWIISKQSLQSYLGQTFLLLTNTTTDIPF